MTLKTYTPECLGRSSMKMMFERFNEKAAAHVVGAAVKGMTAQAEGKILTPQKHVGVWSVLVLGCLLSDNVR